MNFFYREIAPLAKSAHVVLNFWEFSVEGETGESAMHEVFPDGCLSLVYHRNKELKIKRKLVVGLTLNSISKPVFAGDKFWAIRISPAAASVFFGANPQQIQTQPIHFLDKRPNNLERIFSRVSLCKDFAEAIGEFENWIEKNFPDNQIDQKILKAIMIFTKTFGQTKISEVADEIGLSLRQLERKFLRSSGITPKQFARACRVRATAVNLVENAKMNWANRAAETGFTDQAHLTHELQTMTGRSPTGFAKIIRAIRHGEITK